MRWSHDRQRSRKRQAHKSDFVSAAAEPLLIDPYSSRKMAARQDSFWSPPSSDQPLSPLSTLSIIGLANIHRLNKLVRSIPPQQLDTSAENLSIMDFYSTHTALEPLPPLTTLELTSFGEPKGLTNAEFAFCLDTAFVGGISALLSYFCGASKTIPLVRPPPPPIDGNDTCNELVRRAVAMGWSVPPVSITARWDTLAVFLASVPLFVSADSTPVVPMGNGVANTAAVRATDAYSPCGTTRELAIAGANPPYVQILAHAQCNAIAQREDVSHLQREAEGTAQNALGLWLE
ncbi:hypothetical protein BKA62DRAFT_712059 [Auriculariales sp. MPI-PUGE-AT-0066]|nr:hypothetical protein BKA62DRAFT_712059 [Auriculariales sp. MPI-PUGE-AT-0066]